MNRELVQAHYQIERNKDFNAGQEALETDLRNRAIGLASASAITNPQGVFVERDALLMGYRHKAYEPLKQAENEARRLAIAAARAEVEVIADAAARELAYVAKVKELYRLNPGWGEDERVRERRWQTAALIQVSKERPWLLLHIDEAPGDGVPASAAGIGAATAHRSMHEGGVAQTPVRVAQRGGGRAKNPRIESADLRGLSVKAWATALYWQTGFSVAPPADTIANCSDATFRACLFSEFQKIGFTR